MKRKTNLFYNSEEDTRFITFSNYTESMTGNFLSTDTKMFPSKFLCMYIPSIENVIGTVYSINEVNKFKINQYNIKIAGYVTGYVIKNGEDEELYWDDASQNESEIIKIIISDMANIGSESPYIVINGLLDKYNYEDLYNKYCLIYCDFEISQNNDESYVRSIVNITNTIINYNKNAQTLELRNKFIHNIVSQYENKLAFLRDYNISEDTNPENTMYPLYYLLDTITTYDKEAKLVFNSDITEQEYNGTYSDMICIINSTDMQLCNIHKNSKTSLNSIEYANNFSYIGASSYLYGWTNTLTETETTYHSIYIDNKTTYFDVSGSYTYTYTDTDAYTSTYIDGENVVKQGNSYTYNYYNKYNYTYIWLGPSNYKDVSPVYDKTEDNTYYYNMLSNIDYIEYRDADVNIGDSIKFNCVIPLYNIVNTNPNTSSNIIEQKTKSINNTTYTYWEADYCSNVPLGVWFSGDECVTLKKDSLTGMSPSWSLVLSSQFKPFPYSSYMPDETTNTNNANAFKTFSELLTKQNSLLDTINSFTISLNEFNTRLSNLETKLNWSGSTYNVDNLHIEMLGFESKVNKEINNIKELCYTYLNMNTWQVYN